MPSDQHHARHDLGAHRRAVAAPGARHVFSAPRNKGFAAPTMDELHAALQSAATAEGPVLIAVKLDPRRLPLEIAKTQQPPAAALAAGDTAAAARRRAGGLRLTHHHGDEGTFR